MEARAGFRETGGRGREGVTETQHHLQAAIVLLCPLLLKTKTSLMDKRQEQQQMVDFLIQRRILLQPNRSHPAPPLQPP